MATAGGCQLIIANMRLETRYIDIEKSISIIDRNVHIDFISTISIIYGNTNIDIGKSISIIDRNFYINLYRLYR